MTWEEMVFLGVVFLNTLVALGYLLLGCLVMLPVRTSRERREGVEVIHDKRMNYFLRFFVMLLCPVIGPLFFLGSHLFCLLFYGVEPDLEDVEFDKKRVRSYLKADENRQRGIVPLEEAALVSDKRDLRQVMLNTIKGNVDGSLAAIALVLNVEDSESSHYAAAVLSDKLDEFRTTCQKKLKELEEEETGDIRGEKDLIGYMNSVLCQQVFTSLEQRRYVQIMERVAASFFVKDKEGFPAWQYECLCLRLMECGELESAEKWSARLWEQYPGELSAYTVRLKLYFTMKNREAFFSTLQALRHSDVVLDSETLELVRTFS